MDVLKFGMSSLDLINVSMTMAKALASLIFNYVDLDWLLPDYLVI